MLRRYAQSLGVIILVLGVAGLLLGEQSLFGALNVDILEDVIHLVSGGLLAYLGFVGRDVALLRQVVGLLGVVYLLVGIVGFLAPTLFGLLPHGYSLFDDLFHVALGVANMAVAWQSRGEAKGMRSPGRRPA